MKAFDVSDFPIANQNVIVLVKAERLDREQHIDRSYSIPIQRNTNTTPTKYTMMSANNTLIRIVLLVFLSHQYLADAAYFDFTQTHIIDSCKDHGVEARETLELLEEDCTALCGRESMKAFDYADLEEDPVYIVRNTVCQCFAFGPSPDAPKEKTFECWSKAEVWDKSKPLMKCEDDYGIVSPATCTEYCKRIDPQAVAFQGIKGRSRCECGGYPICSDVALSAFSSAPSVRAFSTALALTMGCILALLN